MRRSLVLLILAICSLPLCGCGSSSKKGVAGWQKGVEQYLAEKGGDPDALRNVTLEDNRPGFAVLGGLEPAKSSDSRALLLEHKTIEQRPWFVYLVGIVNQQKVEEIRLIALSVSGGQSVWRVGPRDMKALKLYRDAGLADWQKRSGDRSAPPPQYTTFPRASDVFEVTIAGTKLTATHKASGAQFTDDLGAPGPTTKKKR